MRASDRLLSTPAWVALVFIATLGLTALLSWPALHGPFLFDDFPNLATLSVLGGHTDWRSLANFAAQYEGEPGRPLAMLSFVINDAAWPSEPWSFKYTNLMLHLLVGVVLFGLGRSLAQFRTTRDRASLAALIGAAAWLLHPMQLSTSMLVIQRMTQLSALFSAAGLWAYVTLVGRDPRRCRPFLAVACLGAATILAVLCKETGALVPMYAAVLNATLLRERIRRLPVGARRLLRWGSLLPLMLLLAAICLRWNALTIYAGRDFDLHERLLSECRVVLDYLRQIVVPSLRGGGIYHDDFTVSRGLLEPWTTLPSVVAMAAMAALCMASRRRAPLLAFALGWFLAGHLLESTVFPLELYFEHRNYLPMFGPLFALALAAATALPEWRKAALGAAAAWIAFAAWLTWQQAPIWGSERSLTAIWAIEHPDSSRAIQQRAQYLYRVGDRREAAELMLDAYDRGVRGTDFPLQTLAVACAIRDPQLAARSMELAVRAVTGGSYTSAMLETMGRLRRQSQGAACPGLLDETRWLRLTDLLLANPHYDGGKTQAYVRVERAELFRARRNLDATMRELEAAWSASPQPGLAQLIAATLASAGLYDDALSWIDKAGQHRPTGLRGLISQDEAKSRAMRATLQKLAGRTHADASARDQPPPH